MLKMILIYILGVIIGCIVTNLFLRNKSIGSLVIDNSDPDDTYLFLELSENPNSIRNKKYVTFKVNPKNYIDSQK